MHINRPSLDIEIERYASADLDLAFDVDLAFNMNVCGEILEAQNQSIVNRGKKLKPVLPAAGKRIMDYTS